LKPSIRSLTGSPSIWFTSLRKLRCLLLPAALGFTMLAAPVRAEIVTFEFTGTANRVGSSLAPHFQVGNPYTLTLSYDTTTANQSDPGTLASYKLRSASMVVQATGGTWTANLNGDNNGNVRIENQSSYDRFEVGHNFFSVPSVGGRTAFSWVLTMFTEATGTFTSTALPTALNLANWSTNPSSTRFHIYFDGLGDTFDVRFGVSAINKVAAGAEPPSNIVSGSGTVVGTDILHQNGNRFDQVLLTGQTVTLQTLGNRILRCSFVDTNGDIVQCEFSGPGQFTVALDPATFVAAAPAAKYNQPGVLYVSGRSTVSVTGNTADTYVSIFTVGKETAVNQTLFPVGEVYDGVADVQRLEISGPEIARIATGNTRFGGSSGLTGIFAPNTKVLQRAILHDIVASGSATPVLQFGAASTFSLDAGAVLLAGGSLSQNNTAIDVTSGTGTTLAKITTVSNVRSNGSSLTRGTISSSVIFTGGATGSLQIDGNFVIGGSPGGGSSGGGSSSGSFSANFQDLISGPNSPFKLDGTAGVTWNFSGGNSGTWTVQVVSQVSGFSSTSTISGTYTYELSNNNQTFAMTLNYDQIAASVGGFSGVTLPINASSNPALPKTFAITVNRTSDTSGTYVYSLTMSNGTVTQFSGNYSPAAPLGLPSS